MDKRLEILLEILNIKCPHYSGDPYKGCGLLAFESKIESSYCSCEGELKNCEYDSRMKGHL